MNGLVVAALTVTLLSAASVPVFAQDTDIGGAPRCESRLTPFAIRNLVDLLQLDRSLNPVVDVWNGCIKVIYTHPNGEVRTYFFDPDSYDLVAKQS